MGETARRLTGETPDKWTADEWVSHIRDRSDDSFVIPRGHTAESLAKYLRSQGRRMLKLSRESEGKFVTVGDVQAYLGLGMQRAVIRRYERWARRQTN